MMEKKSIENFVNFRYSWIFVSTVGICGDGNREEYSPMTGDRGRVTNLGAKQGAEKHSPHIWALPY
jgi:hypothetical protein